MLASLIQYSSSINKSFKAEHIAWANGVALPVRRVRLNKRHQSLIEFFRMGYPVLHLAIFNFPKVACPGRAIFRRFCISALMCTVP